MKTLEEIEAVIAKLDQQIPLLVEQRSMARGYRQAILEKSEEATKPDLKVAESKKA